MNAKTKRRMVVVTGIIVIVLVVILAVVGGTSSAKTVSVAEAATGSYADQKIQVSGNVVENSFATEGNVLTFDIYDPNGDITQQLRVRFEGGVSATFGNDVTAICTGKVGEDGVLNASELVTKCPSKYENATNALTVSQLTGYGDEVVDKPVKVAGAVKDGTLKAAGEGDATNYKEVVYEGYAPCGVAVIVEVVTDNLNRTASEVRHIFDKCGGSLGATGCVSWKFERKGVIEIDNSKGMDEDELMMLALDAGAEDFSEEEDSFEILTSPDDLEAVRETLEAKKIPMAQAEETMIPQNYVALDDETALKNLQRTLDLLEEDDDVQAVYTNLDE